MNLRMKMSRTNIVSILIVALIACSVGLWFSLTHQVKIKDLNQIKLANADFIYPTHTLSHFNLLDINKQAFTEKNLEGHWSFIFFGFTNCPSVCPTTMGVLNQTYKRLAQNNKNPLPQVIFVSIDPERDTTETIKKYLTSFNANFLGVTAPEKTIEDLTKQLGIVYLKTTNEKDPEATAENNYGFDHSGVILLTNPKGELQALFTLPHQATTMADDFNKIVNYYNS